jgi:hypothetical protein
MMEGIVDTIDTYMHVNILAIRIDDDFHLVQDRDDLNHKVWVNPDYVRYV